MLNIVLWVVFGAFVGWVSSIIMNRDAQQGALGNIAAGVVGASIGGFLFDRSVSPSLFSLGSLLTATVGAMVLLGILNLFQRGSLR